MMNFEKLYDVIWIFYEWEITENEFDKYINSEFPELDINEKTFVFFTLYD